MEHPNPEGWLVLALKNNIQNERRRSMAHQIVSLDEIAPVAEAEPDHYIYVESGRFCCIKFKKIFCNKKYVLKLL